MKHLSSLFLLFFIFNTLPAAENTGFEHGYILSFPKSGNTWIRYIVEYLTKHPSTYGEKRMQKHYHPVNLPLGSHFDLGVDLSNPPFLKGHSRFYFRDNATATFPEKKKKPLILVLRDFKECFPRFFSSFEEIQKFVHNEIHERNHYCENIRFFLKWKPENRHLIYYEKLILRPQEAIRELGKFLKADPLVVEEFLANYAMHKKACIEFYDRELKSVTKGKSIHYHSKKLSPQQIALIKREIQLKYPELKTILKRYY